MSGEIERNTERERWDEKYREKRVREIQRERDGMRNTERERWDEKYRERKMG